MARSGFRRVLRETGAVATWRGTAWVALLTALSVLGCTGPAPTEEDREHPGSSYLDLREPGATRCSRTLGAVHIDGDLLVPRDRSCRLEGTAVAGRVTVSFGATLVATDARFGEGIGAHSFDRVALLGGRAEGRPRSWSYGNRAEADQVVDFVFDSGREVELRDGPSDGRYYILGTTGRVEVVGLNLDLGRVYCAGNARRPRVRAVSGESPGVLQGQCAGLRNFGDSDF